MWTKVHFAAASMPRRFEGMTVESIVAAIQVTLEMIAIVFVFLGAVIALWQLAVAAVARRRISFNSVRLDLARYLALALEFLLAADILQTTMEPDWSTLGELATIAAIRTALNYFLAREMREERELAARGGFMRARSPS